MLVGWRLADEVAHFFAFGLEVFFEGRLGCDLGGDTLGDVNAYGFKGFDFFRIVGDEANGGDVEELEDFGGEFVVAAVCGEAKFEVGFDGVAALILEFVGL